MSFSNRNAFDIVWCNDLLFLCVLIMQNKCRFREWDQSKAAYSQHIQQKIVPLRRQDTRNGSDCLEISSGLRHLCGISTRCPSKHRDLREEQRSPCGWRAKYSSISWWHIWAMVRVAEMISNLKPWEINMEPKNGGLVQMIFLFN